MLEILWECKVGSCENGDKTNEYKLKSEIKEREEINK